MASHGQPRRRSSRAIVLPSTGRPEHMRWTVARDRPDASASCICVRMPWALVHVCRPSGRTRIKGMTLRIRFLGVFPVWLTRPRVTAAAPAISMARRPGGGNRIRDTFAGLSGDPPGVSCHSLSRVGVSCPVLCTSLGVALVTYAGPLLSGYAKRAASPNEETARLWMAPGQPVHKCATRI